MKHKLRYSGFTLIEMLIVLLVIGVLVLLFAPNLSKQGDKMVQKGDAAVVEVVKTQMELYKLNTGSNQEPEKKNWYPIISRKNNGTDMSR